MNGKEPPGASGSPRPPRSLPGPSFWVAAGLTFLLALVLAFVPLFNLLGYEFCASLSMLVSLTGGPVALGVVRRRTVSLAEAVHPGGPVLRLFLRALVTNLLTLVLPLAVIVLNAFRVPNCNPIDGLLFFLLLPVTTVAVVTTWGVGLGLAVRRSILGGLLYALIWLAVAGFNLMEFWYGPQMDSYNQLVGWLAGPMYDEVIKPAAPLLFSRLYGLSGAGLVLFLAAGLYDPRADRLVASAVVRNRRPLTVAGLCLLLAVGLHAFGDTLGFGRSRGAVESLLSGTTTTPHFVIHHPPGLPEETTRLLERDHEFRYSQIEKFLGPQTLPTIHSYLFPDATRKRRMLGAGRTQFAKPWSFSIFLNGTDFPHATLKHELAHVMAGGFGSWPFRVSARGGLWPNVGFIEGLAVAVDWPADKFDPHTWSAAQRLEGQAPDLRSLFDPVGFWTRSARRSYTMAGSFVRYLLDRHGIEPFRRAYREGTLEGTYPVSGEQLLDGYEKFLDEQPVPQGVVEAARLRFASTSIFQRVCAHEIASLRVEVRRQLGARRPERAAAAVQRILSHLPADVGALEAMAEVHELSQQPDKAIAVLQELIAREDLGSAHRARLAGRLGDLLARADRLPEARLRYRAILAAHLDDGTDRLALVKLEALERGEAGRLVLDFLARGKGDETVLLDLREAAAEQPGWGALWYLLGRQLFNRGSYARALPYLERSGVEGLGHPALAAENLRLLARCAYHEGRPGDAMAFLAVLTQFPRHPGELLWARDWLGRIRFEQVTYAE